MGDIIEKIRKKSFDNTDPDGTKKATIDIDGVKEVSRESAISPADVEILALGSGIFPRRYLRNAGTLGLEGQKRLLESQVAIIGMGGLGGTVARHLARFGVGNLLLVDDDVFSADNLNRQEVSYEDTLNVPKVDVAKKELERINSSISIKSFKMRADEKTLGQVLGGGHQYSGGCPG